MLGTIINERYRLIAEVGEGGMGIVYQAHDKTLDRDAIVRHQAASALRRLGCTLGDDPKYNHITRLPS